jgi:hypothetical protein
MVKLRLYCAGSVRFGGNICLGRIKRHNNRTYSDYANEVNRSYICNGLVLYVINMKLRSEFLAKDTEVRIRFPALPDFLISMGSGKGST